MSEDKNKKIPEHVAIIMDGNRRWAKERNLHTLEGHLKGFNKMKQVPEWLFSRGVKIVTFFAFSTENWQRAAEEVNYIMKLLREGIEEQTEKAIKNGYKILISGRVDDLPGDLPEACHDFINKTKNGSNGVINICLNYGGRAEMVDAVRKIVKNNIDLGQVHEGLIKKYLYNGDLTDPDIIIRTSGEQRLSGFMLWQSAYSELLFMKKYWPDFEEFDIDFIIKEYGERQRRFGGD